MKWLRPLHSKGLVLLVVFLLCKSESGCFVIMVVYCEKVLPLISFYFATKTGSRCTNLLKHMQTDMEIQYLCKC